MTLPVEMTIFQGFPFLLIAHSPAPPGKNAVPKTRMSGICVLALGNCIFIFFKWRRRLSGVVNSLFFDKI
jgi:hypothetical protein